MAQERRQTKSIVKMTPYASDGVFSPLGKQTFEVRVPAVLASVVNMAVSTQSPITIATTIIVTIIVGKDCLIIFLLSVFEIHKEVVFWYRSFSSQFRIGVKRASPSTFHFLLRLSSTIMLSKSSSM